MGVVSPLAVLLLGAVLPGIVSPGTRSVLMTLGMAAGRAVLLAAIPPSRGEGSAPGTLSPLVAGKVGTARLWISWGAALVVDGVLARWLLGWPVVAC